MPIAYTCPHCGKQYSVADEYAGQTGPCAACGKSITVPQGGAYVPPPSSYAPAKAAGGGAVAAIVIGVCVLLLCPGILIALLLPAVQSSREAARRMSSTNNMRQLSLALLNYHDVHRNFPPAVVTDASGTPLYSGRVLLLPFMEQAPLYDQWDKSQPWDSPTNLPLSQTAIKTFQDPSGKMLPGMTDYLFVAGTGTAFDPSKPQDISTITDGTSNTLAMIEVANSGIHWAEPRDFDASQAVAFPKGNHPGGNIGAMFDGAVRFISSSVAPKTVREMSTASGGEAPSY